MTAPLITPNKTGIASHLRYLFGSAQEALIELAWTAPADGHLCHGQLFYPQEMDKIVNFAIATNTVAGQSIYLGAALRRMDTQRYKRASDSDFYALPSVYADFDAENALSKAEQLCADKGVPPTAKVITGRHPYPRGQLWWQLKEPLRDPKVGSRINRAIAVALGGDTAVCNPGRVMRLGGSIAWPRKEGRITELTTFEEISPRRYSLKELETAFPIVQAVIAAAVPSTAEHGPAPGIDALLAQLRPNNWHLPMLRAVARMVACGWRDKDILVRVERHTLPGWTIEQTRYEVMAMIAGARRKGFGTRAKAARLLGDIPPGYDSKPLARDDATAQLKSAIAGWFDRAVPLALARKELARRRRARFARKLPAAVAEEIRQSVKDQFGVKDLRKAPRMAVQAAAGLGKTMEVVIQILARKELWGMRIWIMVPTIDLADRLADQFAELSAEAGPNVRVMRGRSASALEVRRPNEPKTMCRKPDAADKAGRLGLNVYKTLCRSGMGDCEYYYHCPWIRQWQDQSPGIYIWSHEYLHLPMLADYPPPDMVICDESVVEVLAGGLQFAPDRLTESPTWADGEQAETVTRCLRVVHSALTGGGPVMATIRASGVTKSELARAADIAEGSEDGNTGITPEMPETEAVERLDALEDSEREKLARLLRQLAREIDLPRDVSHAVELLHNVPVLVEGKVERQNRVSVRWRRRPLIGRNRSLLLIDADADKEITRRLFGGDIEHVPIPVRRNAVVTQCCDTNASRQSLLGFAGATPEYNIKAKERLEEVKRIIRSLAQSTRLLVVCPLPVRRAITGEKDDRLPLACEWSGATISHFGRIRGVDDWKGYEACLTIGREQPPPLAIEALARSIWDDDPIPLDLPGEYRKTARGYRMSSGTRLGVEVDVHPDQRVQRVLELKRERESLQAIDRIRLIHPRSIKDIYIVCKVPLDIDVDRLAGFSDLLNCTGTKLEQAYRKACCGLPLVSDLLAQKWPDLYTSKKACESSIYRDLGGEKFDVLKPQIVSICASGISKPAPILVHFGDTEALVVRCRPRSAAGRGGHRNWSRALVAADTPYFRDKVQDVMGGALEFEFPPTGMVSASAAGTKKSAVKKAASEKLGSGTVQRDGAT